MRLLVRLETREGFPVGDHATLLGHAQLRRSLGNGYELVSVDVEP